MSVRFTKDHEWVVTEGEIATIGISAFAAEQLGDVVYVELPAIGKVFAQGDAMAVVESVKAASDVYAPVTGEIVEINNDLIDNPEIINSAGTGNEGWFVKMKLSDLSQLDALMDLAAYKTFVES
jgi:glycine cleavage system H protein